MYLFYSYVHKSLCNKIYTKLKSFLQNELLLDGRVRMALDESFYTIQGLPHTRQFTGNEFQAIFKKRIHSHLNVHIYLLVRSNRFLGTHPGQPPVPCWWSGSLGGDLTCMPSPREGECDRSLSSCQGLTRLSTAGVDPEKLNERTL